MLHLFESYVCISSLPCNVFTIDSVEPSRWMNPILIANTWQAAETGTRLIYSTKHNAQCEIQTVQKLNVIHK